MAQNSLSLWVSKNTASSFTFNFLVSLESANEDTDEKNLRESVCGLLLTFQHLEDHVEDQDPHCGS